MFYVIADARQLDLELVPDNGGEIVRVTEMIKAAARRAAPRRAPGEPGHPRHHDRPAVRAVAEPGRLAPQRRDRLDRPARLGPARHLDGRDRPLAVRHRHLRGDGVPARARAQLAVGETFLHEGILGTVFTGRLLEETTRRRPTPPWCRRSRARRGSPASRSTCSTRPTRSRRGTRWVTSGVADAAGADRRRRAAGRSRRATRSRSRCCAAASIPAAAAPSAWPATARTACARSTASRTCALPDAGPRRRRRASARARAACAPVPEPGDGDAGRGSSTCTATWSWSAAGRAGRAAAAEARAAGRTCVELDARDGRRGGRHLRRAAARRPPPRRDAARPRGRGRDRDRRRRGAAGLPGQRARGALHRARRRRARRRRAAAGRVARDRAETRRRALRGRHPRPGGRRPRRGGAERRDEVDAVVLDLGLHPARRARAPGRRARGRASSATRPPPAGCRRRRRDGASSAAAPARRSPTWHRCWERGFHELELVKRASLCGTGTCQGGACMPHLRAFVTAKSGQPRGAVHRPAGVAPVDHRRGRRPTCHLDPFRRTALHDEHLALGARMDRFGGWWRPWNYGDFLDEYWAVREGVSLGDVSTLGKMIVTGPDVVEASGAHLPDDASTTSGPGAVRYVLLLNERGHVIDDGMVVPRATDDGATVRADVHLRRRVVRRGMDPRLDRVVGARRAHPRPHAGARRDQRDRPAAPPSCCAACGLAEPPRFLQHVHTRRRRRCRATCCASSFTGEASFELHHPRDHSVELWQALMAAGARPRRAAARPAGAVRAAAREGPRDRRHGHRDGLHAAPARHGLGGEARQRRDFIGRDALLRTDAFDDHRRLFGLTMEGPAPVEGAPIWVGGDDRRPRHVELPFPRPRPHRACSAGRSITPFADTVTSRRPRGARRRDCRSTTRRAHVRAPEPLHALRIVARPAALDALALPTGAVMLRIAPDDALVDRCRDADRRRSRTRSSSPSTAFVHWLDCRPRRVRALLADHIDWPLPAERPARPGADRRRAGQGR